MNISMCLQIKMYERVLKEFFLLANTSTNLYRWRIVGGCDIITQMHNNGELKEEIEKVSE